MVEMIIKIDATVFKFIACCTKILLTSSKDILSTNMDSWTELKLQQAR